MWGDGYWKQRGFRATPFIWEEYKREKPVNKTPIEEALEVQKNSHTFYDGPTLKRILFAVTAIAINATQSKTDTSEQVNLNSDVMQAVPKDAPVLKAWNNYKAGSDFLNSRRWAMHEEHVDGALWAAFYAGFFANAVFEVNIEQPAVELEAEEPREILASRLIDVWCAEHGGKISWAKAVQISGIVTNQPEPEMKALLDLAFESGACEMCGRSDK